MIKTLIVEDELLARTGLRLLIDWEQFGFELLDDAVDGEEAYSRIVRERPELIILDLNIPKINGLKLLEMLEQSHIQTKVIICSCDTTFESAVAAMKGGASYYLMKYGLTKEELVKALDKVVGLGKENNGGSIASNKGADNGEERQRNLPDTISDSTLLTIVLPSDLTLSGQNDGLVDDIANQFFSQVGAEIRTYQYNGSFLLTVNRSRLPLEMIRHLQEDLCFLLSGGVKVTYGFIKSLDQNGIKKFVKRSQVLAFIYDGKESVIPVSVSTEEAEKNSLSMYTPAVDTLWKDMEESSLGGILDDLDSIFDLLKEKSPDTMSVVRQVFVAILSLFTKTADKMNGNIEEVVVNGRTNHNQVIVQFDSLSQAREWFSDFIKAFMEHFDLRLKSADSAIVRSALEYIDSHISSPISLSETASFIGVSDSYLSSTFKSVIGDNFIHFVNARKMDRAKELLREGQKVRQVAECLGYSDVSYFSKVFKKMKGSSPEAFFKE